jgi:hypothetical protein
VDQLAASGAAEVLDAAISAGRELTIDEAVAEALGTVEAVSAGTAGETGGPP